MHKFQLHNMTHQRFDFFRHKLDHNEHPISGILSLIPDPVKFHRKVTPLCWAAMYKSPIEYIQTLIANGAEVNVKYSYDIAPLVMALEAGYLDMCSLLISKGARVDIYHPEVVGNLAVIAGMQHWKGLKLVLMCNAEVRTLFNAFPAPWMLPRMPHFVKKYGFENPDPEEDSELKWRESDSEESDCSFEHSEPNRFFEIMTIAKLNARRLHVRAPICKFQNLGILLQILLKLFSNQYLVFAPEALSCVTKNYFVNLIIFPL